jgi:hypothetical protein
MQDSLSASINMWILQGSDAAVHDGDLDSRRIWRWPIRYGDSPQKIHLSRWSDKILLIEFRQLTYIQGYVGLQRPKERQNEVTFSRKVDT